MHTIEVNQHVLAFEDGLMIGNGDLSVSMFQRASEVVWRFGKNDVWDRRFDFSDSPEPAHIEEIEKGMREQAWKGGGYDAAGSTDSNVELTPEEQKRVNELCSGTNCYARRPYPCPKPVGELSLNIPTDHRGWKISQRVHIETGVMEIDMSWDNGAEIRAKCYIAPDTNVLVVDWEVLNWNENTSMGCSTPVWFTLHRWPDPTIYEHAARHYQKHRYNHFFGSVRAHKATPLAPPTVEFIDGQPVVRQGFEPDIQFPDGFRYYMDPLADDAEITRFHMFNEPGATIIIQPNEEARTGSLAVHVPTSSDEGGAEAQLARVREAVAGDLAGAIDQWKAASLASAQEFWSRSSVTMDDKLMEDLWYAAIHTRRCAYRGGVIAPGLALPSTVGDYSFWHGDYHMNYNYQQPFYGDFMANQVDMGDSFFPGMHHMVELGKYLAKTYWAGNRGTFIQLTGYPFPIKDDPYGNGSLARMAYMTGWVAGYYWWRYCYTLDKDWLAEVGYPVIRDCALFYTDFLQKFEDGSSVDDGKYHAFPSPQGEYYYTGDMKDYMDQAQVIRHARYNLMAAIGAAEAIGVDAELLAQWKDIHENLVVVDEPDELDFSEEEVRRYHLNSPAFIGIDIGKSIPRPGDKLKWLKKPFDSCAVLPWWWMICLRNDVYDANESFSTIHDWVEQWRAPNGALRAMGTQGLGYVGHYGEGEGVIQPLQETMLQSWDDRLRIFPAWPKGMNGSYTTLRAEGAFLVSASMENDVIGPVTILSEKGAPCRLQQPWESGVAVVDSAGKAVDVSVGDDDVATFATTPGETYTVSAK